MRSGLVSFFHAAPSRSFPVTCGRSRICGSCDLELLPLLLSSCPFSSFPLVMILCARWIRTGAGGCEQSGLCFRQRTGPFGYCVPPFFLRLLRLPLHLLHPMLVGKAVSGRWSPLRSRSPCLSARRSAHTASPLLASLVVCSPLRGRLNFAATRFDQRAGRVRWRAARRSSPGPLPLTCFPLCNRSCLWWSSVFAGSSAVRCCLPCALVAPFDPCTSWSFEWSGVPPPAAGCCVFCLAPN